MNFFFDQPRELKFDVARQLSTLTNIWRTLRYFRSQFHVIVGQNELEEVIIVQIAVTIFVEQLEYGEEVVLLDVIDLVITQEFANVISAYHILPVVWTTRFYPLKCCIRLKLFLRSQKLPLFFYKCLVFRNCFKE